MAGLWPPPRRGVLALGIFGAVLLAFIPTGARCADPRQELVKQQQSDNRTWEKEAKDVQAEHFRQAERFYRLKRYNSAAQYFRKVLNVEYLQWELREHTRVARLKGQDSTVIVPALRKIRVTLDTPLNEKAEERLVAIEKAKVTETVDEAFSDAEQLLQDGQTVAAYVLFRRLRDARLPSELRTKYSARIDKHIQTLESEAGLLLDKVERCVAENNLDGARQAVREFHAKFGQFPECAPIHARYRSIVESPAVYALVRADEAQRRLAAAEQFLQEGNDLDAHDRLADLSRAYSDTAAGQRAAELLAEMRTDKARMRQIANLRAAKECEVLLRHAANYVANGYTDKARAIYEKIIALYRDTDYGEEALQALADLGEGGPADE